jgi:uncharacterized glyoxalase superfamily protein PhnB
LRIVVERRARGRQYPSVVPMLAYEDGVAALEWLANVFGFIEQMRLTDSDGSLSHGEMVVGDGLIMLATPSRDYQNPKRHTQRCDAARRWLSVPWVVDGVLVYVDDVQAHYDRVKNLGATILSELEEDEHGRRYRAEDLEGHRWMFMERW